MNNGIDMATLRRIMNEAKRLARQYRALTGKPLGITGEVGELCAADLLGLELTEARCPCYDATDRGGRRVQIKTRCVLQGSKPGQRVGRIKFDHPWDEVLLVLLDEEFEPIEMHAASRSAIETALKVPGSKARKERGALGVSKFKTISKCIWSRESK